jgi:hypothetical protein
MQQVNRKIIGATARHSRGNLAQVGLLKGAHQDRVRDWG